MRLKHRFHRARIGIAGNKRAERNKNREGNERAKKNIGPIDAIAPSMPFSLLLSFHLFLLAPPPSSTASPLQE
jgi:hypothetical protein